MSLIKHFAVNIPQFKDYKNEKIFTFKYLI